MKTLFFPFSLIKTQQPRPNPFHQPIPAPSRTAAGTHAPPHGHRYLSSTFPNLGFSFSLPKSRPRPLSMEYLRGGGNGGDGGVGSVVALFVRSLFEAMGEQNKGVQAGAAVYLAKMVHCAGGGGGVVLVATSLTSPKTPRLGTASFLRSANMGSGKLLYNQMMTRVNVSLQNGGSIQALLWYQGEVDTLTLEDAKSYKGRLHKFFLDLRDDPQNPLLPIIQEKFASRLSRRDSLSTQSTSTRTGCRYPTWDGIQLIAPKPLL